MNWGGGGFMTLGTMSETFRGPGGFIFFIKHLRNEAVLKIIKVPTAPELLSSSTAAHADSPGADPHEGDGRAGKEDRHEQKRLPAPDV